MIQQLFHIPKHIHLIMAMLNMVRFDSLPYLSGTVGYACLVIINASVTPSTIIPSKLFLFLTQYGIITTSALVVSFNQFCIHARFWFAVACRLHKISYI